MKVLRNEEKAQFELRALYESYGYGRYKMSKFEEYDLYARNKDSLISDGVITFTDTNGKLMALKPDVTLSIIKGSRQKEQKVYYNENVYRVSKGTKSFKEIMQAGIERIGNIDGYSLFEVVMLAIKSLKTLSENCVLDICHLGIITEVIGSLEKPVQKEILRCICDKNVHELPKTFVTDTVIKLMNVSGSPKEAISQLYDILGPIKALTELEKTLSLVQAAGLLDVINIDFSVSADIGYYNGIVFKGYIKGIPDCVISGGQYDGLMKKMGSTQGAVGFAVYLDSLERLYGRDRKYDTDAVIIYDDNTDLAKVYNESEKLTADGKSVGIYKTLPEGYKCKEIIKMGGKSDA